MNTTRVKRIKHFNHSASVFPTVSECLEERMIIDEQLLRSIHASAFHQPINSATLIFNNSKTMNKQFTKSIMASMLILMVGLFFSAHAQNKMVTCTDLKNGLFHS